MTPFPKYPNEQSNYWLQRFASRLWDAKRPKAPKEIKAPYGFSPAQIANLRYL
jgi:hypothetical protein